jgi:hypothetical protein
MGFHKYFTLTVSLGQVVGANVGFHFYCAGQGTSLCTVPEPNHAGCTVHLQIRPYGCMCPMLGSDLATYLLVPIACEEAQGDNCSLRSLPFRYCICTVAAGTVPNHIRNRNAALAI